MMKISVKPQIPSPDCNENPAVSEGKAAARGIVMESIPIVIGTAPENISKNCPCFAFQNPLTLPKPKSNE